MNCNKSLKLISKYFDKQTDALTNNILFAHIEKCQNCKKEFDLLNKIYTNFPEKQYITLNPYFNQKLKTYIHNKQNNCSKNFIFKPIGIFFSLATLLFILSFSLIKTNYVKTISSNISQNNNNNLTIDEDIGIFGLIELAHEINDESYILKEG